MGNKPLFRALLPLVNKIDFSMNVNVSVFETNIRVIGGLLSAHIMTVTDSDLSESYDWKLLDLAEDVAKRILPAFNTPTGLPYSSIHLLHGVAENESLDVCTACAGTFSLEFTWLSLLTGNPVYEVNPCNVSYIDMTLIL